MTGRTRNVWRIALAGLLAWAAPLTAQTTTNATPPATTQTPPASSNTVGPRELQNFNLGGTVIRRAEPEAAVAPPPKPETATPRTLAPAATATRSDAQPPRKAAPRPAPTAQVASPPATSLTRPAPIPSATIAPAISEAAPEPVAAAPVGPPSDQGMPWWPWALAVLALAAGAAVMLWRRQRLTPATAGVSELLEQQSPAEAPPSLPPRAATPRPAAPQPAASMPQPAPPPLPRPAPEGPAGGGIVSRGLKPEIGFEFTPLRAEIDAAGAAMLSVELTIINGGGAPARDLLVEAMMINAGPRQDEEIGQFFRNPVGRGDRIPIVPPMGRVTLRMRVPLPAERLAPLEYEGRRLLVPLVAVNALFRSAQGDAQQSASFLVGRGGEDGGKMAPFSLDRGARAWTGLSTRQHSLGLQT